MIKVKSIWNAVKENDRVGIFLPNLLYYKKYHREKIMKHFHQTLASIQQINPKYIILILSKYTTTQDYYDIESIYNKEIQIIDSLEVFDNEQFNKYFKNDTLYTLSIDYTNAPKILSNKYIDKIILDDISIDPKEEWFSTIDITYDYGKCYIYELLNIKLYLCKYMNKIVKSLHMNMMHQDYDQNDIVLILGKKVEYSILNMEEVLNDLCKYNLLTNIYCSSNTHLEMCKRIIRKNRYRCSIIRLPDIMKSNTVDDFISRLKRTSVEYNTFMFMGEFEMEDDITFDKWKKEREYVMNNSIFDIAAYSTLLYDEHNIEDNNYRITMNAYHLIKKYTESDDASTSNY